VTGRQTEALGVVCMEGELAAQFERDVILQQRWHMFGCHEAAIRSRFHSQSFALAHFKSGDAPWYTKLPSGEFTNAISPCVVQGYD